MEKVFFLLSFILIHCISLSQTPIDRSTDGYSNWLYVNSDKALQVRYKQIKQESELSYFEVQFKINFDDPIFCVHPTCLGYLFVFSYPGIENDKHNETSYKFYNSFKGIYTLPSIIPIRMNFPDGSKRYLRKEGFYYTTSDNNNEIANTYLFNNCVDDILMNKPDYHRCKPYTSNFKESEAKTIK